MGKARTVLRLAGVPLVAVAAFVVVRSVDAGTLARTWSALTSDPTGLLVALAAYASAFLLRARVWQLVLPELPTGHAWAAIHLSLAANHVLPLRLGEAVRPAAAARRAGLSLAATTASTVVLRAADVLAVAAMAALLAPTLVTEITGLWIVPVIVAVTLVCAIGIRWLGRLNLGLKMNGRLASTVGLAAVAGWVLESAVLMQTSRWAGLDISFFDAILVTAVTIAAQVFAIAPGGFGTYEAAGTAALVGLGAGPAPALAAVLSAHALKTAYSLVTGAAALFAPGPRALGRLRLSRAASAAEVVGGRPSPENPVVLFLPAYNEQDSIAAVIRRAPEKVLGHPVEVIVVDDGSLDDTVGRARDAGASIVSLGQNRGLGAAVRTGFEASLTRRPAAVVFCDADGEYAPEELPALCAPILSGEADYVIGSRFAGEIERMLPHRRFGNKVLTRLLAIVARQDITDGQSGYRALSPAAASSAEVIHDFNYAQVLTLDLLGKGFRYLEVPISYSFRTSGESFVKLGRYLRHVVPAIHRELNAG